MAKVMHMECSVSIRSETYDPHTGMSRNIGGKKCHLSTERIRLNIEINIYIYMQIFSTPNSLTVWITANCGKFLKNGNTRPPDLPPEKSVCKSRRNSESWTWNHSLVPNRERSMSRLYIVTLLI